MSDYSQTTNLRLFKPAYDADAEQWGTHLNNNSDTLDALFAPGGTGGAPWLPLSGGHVTGALNVTATGGSTVRSVQDRFGEIIDVRDYGAVCNGTTNDLTAVQAALNAVPTSGGTVFIPGLSAVSAPVVIKSQTRLVGNGPGSGLVVIAPFVSQGALIHNQNNTATTLTDHDIRIENMTLDFGYWTGDGASHVVFMNYVRNVAVLNCVLQVRTCGNATAMVGCTNTLVQGCSAYDFRNCAYDHWSGPTNARVIGCYAQTSTSLQMINFNPELITGAVGPLADTLVVAGCELVCTGSASVPLQLEPLGAGDNTANVVVSGNILKNCHITCRRATRNVTIVGNSFVAPQTAGAIIDSYTLDSGTPSDIVIVGNNITDPATTSANGGVIRCYVNNATIIGNRISGTLSAPAIDTSTNTPTVMGNSIPTGASNNVPNAIASAGIFASLSTSGRLSFTGAASSATDLTHNIDLTGAGAAGMNYFGGNTRIMTGSGGIIAFDVAGTNGGYVGSDGWHGALSAPTFPNGANVSGSFLRTTYNASGVFAPVASGGAIAWNASGGNAEVDYINTYTSGATYSHTFWQQTGASAQTALMRIGPNGTVYATGYLGIGGTAGPQWITQTGAPSATLPVGSLCSRTDGAVGSTLYISRGGGTWAAVAGV